MVQCIYREDTNERRLASFDTSFITVAYNYLQGWQAVQQLLDAAQRQGEVCDVQLCQQWQIEPLYGGRIYSNIHQVQCAKSLWQMAQVKAPSPALVLLIVFHPEVGEVGAI